MLFVFGQVFVCPQVIWCVFFHPEVSRSRNCPSLLLPCGVQGGIVLPNNILCGYPFPTPVMVVCSEAELFLLFDAVYAADCGNHTRENAFPPPGRLSPHTYLALSRYEVTRLSRPSFSPSHSPTCLQLKQRYYVSCKCFHRLYATLPVALQ